MDDQKVGMVFYDRGIKFCFSIHLLARRLKLVKRPLIYFQGPAAKDNVKLLYTEGTPEIAKA
eukprot:13301851-Heterocapsa_arctica.AAC.1